LFSDQYYFGGFELLTANCTTTERTDKEFIFSLANFFILDCPGPHSIIPSKKDYFCR